MAGVDSGPAAVPDPDSDAVRAEVRAWLADAWDPSRPLREWRELLVESGWGAPCWPRERYGRGLPPPADELVREEFAEVGAVGPATGTSMWLVAPTLIAHGSDELCRRLLRPILTGEHRWCQLFSEPGSGSDLAGLTTRAVRDGERWVVNGQKVWTSGARSAAYGMLLARTDWDAPKHRGITFFALPMDQPGVEVRPLRQMNGYASFNEVFLDDAVVTDTDRVGELGGGWAVALTTLAHERGLGARRAPRPPEADPGRTVREAYAESAEYFETYRWYPQRAGRPDLLVQRARETGRLTDPVLRQDLARLLSLRRAAQWTAERAAADRALGRPPGPEGSLTKLLNSRIAKGAAELHARIAGPAGVLTGEPVDDDPGAGRSAAGLVAEILLSVPAVSIAGGTDEIQRTIVAERVLGLPKEPDPVAGRPFREVRTNPTRRDPR